jgi:hypothetical protein
MLTTRPPVVGTRSTEATLGTTLAYEIAFVIKDHRRITDTTTCLEYELKSLPHADRHCKPLSLSHADIIQLLPRNRTICDSPTDEYPPPSTATGKPPEAAIAPELDPPPDPGTSALTTACTLYENTLDTDDEATLATDTKPPTSTSAPATPRQRMLESDTHNDD